LEDDMTTVFLSAYKVTSSMAGDEQVHFVAARDIVEAAAIVQAGLPGRRVERLEYFARALRATPGTRAVAPPPAPTDPSPSPKARRSRGKSPSQAARLVALLCERGEAVHLDELVERLGTTRGTVQYVIYLAVKAGRVQRIGTRTGLVGLA
jgi:hypothetical protein